MSRDTWTTGLSLERVRGENIQQADANARGRQKTGRESNTKLSGKGWKPPCSKRWTSIVGGFGERKRKDVAVTACPREVTAGSKLNTIRSTHKTNSVIKPIVRTHPWRYLQVRKCCPLPNDVKVVNCQESRNALRCFPTC